MASLGAVTWWMRARWFSTPTSCTNACGSRRSSPRRRPGSCLAVRSRWCPSRSTLPSRPVTGGSAALFTPRRMRAMEESLRAQLRAIIAPLVARGSADLVTEVAEVYPTQVFLTLFGLRWRTATSSSRGRTPSWRSHRAVPRTCRRMTLASRGTDRYLDDLIARRRGVPGEDVLSDCCAGGEDALSDRESLVGLPVASPAWTPSPAPLG